MPYVCADDSYVMRELRADAIWTGICSKCRIWKSRSLLRAYADDRILWMKLPSRSRLGKRNHSIFQACYMYIVRKLHVRLGQSRQAWWVDKNQLAFANSSKRAWNLRSCVPKKGSNVTQRSIARNNIDCAAPHGVSVEAYVYACMRRVCYYPISFQATDEPI